jgi:hypothetical protein
MLFLLDGGWCSNTDSGMINYSYGHDLDSSARFELLYKYPASKGDTYIWHTALIRVASTDSVVTVPSGTFHCFVYQFYNAGMLGKIDFVSPRIGRIKYVEHFAGQFPQDPMRIFAVSELVEFTLK